MTENYADPVDRASVEEQRNLEMAINAARNQKVRILAFTGRCYNCDERLSPGQRFCDADCRDDFEKRTRQQ